MSLHFRNERPEPVQGRKCLLCTIVFCKERMSPVFSLPDKFSYLKDKIEATYRPTNILRYTPAKTKPWESKLGGVPYLTSIDNYPKDADGEPMMLLAQIDLSEMPPLPHFPEKGLLQFYIVNDEDYGYDLPCRVVYIEHFSTNEEELLTEHPYSEDMDEDVLPYEKECRIHFEQDIMPISSTNDSFDELIGDVTDKNDREELYSLLYSAESRMGGYPDFVQNPVESYESGEKGVLLLQLDCDDEAGLMFGDSGNCQFFISEEDLKQKDFSDVCYDWACC